MFNLVPKGEGVSDGVVRHFGRFFLPLTKNILGAITFNFPLELKTFEQTLKFHRCSTRPQSPQLRRSWDTSSDRRSTRRSNFKIIDRKKLQNIKKCKHGQLDNPKELQPRRVFPPQLKQKRMCSFFEDLFFFLRGKAILSAPNWLNSPNNGFQLRESL